MVLKLCIICRGRDWTIGKSNSDNFRLLLKSSSPYWQLSNVANAIYLLQNTEILEISSGSSYLWAAVRSFKPCEQFPRRIGECPPCRFAGLHRRLLSAANSPTTHRPTPQKRPGTAEVRVTYQSQVLDPNQNRISSKLLVLCGTETPLTNPSPVPPLP